METKRIGEIRVGRSLYKNDRIILPEFPNFSQITVLTKMSSQYGELGPYHLKDLNGRILENVWQFSKIYPKVPKVEIPYSSGNPKIVWSWPEEVHMDENGNPTTKYWKWRNAGMNNDEPVRNPVTWKYISTCKYALSPFEKYTNIIDESKKLDYITARKKIYFPLYVENVIREPKFWELKKRLLNGENLLIIEIDGPHQESLQYYIDKYGVPKNFIEQNSIESTDNNLSILLNDPKHPFGHGYCLAWALKHINDCPFTLSASCDTRRETKIS